MAALDQTRRPLVLLAASDPLDQAVLETDLIREGYRVLTAHDVAEALRIVRTEQVDIVVTDLGLAGGGGFSLVRGATRDGQQIPAVAFTSYPVNDEIRNIARESGVGSVVEAPYSTGRLRAVIEYELTKAQKELTPGDDGMLVGDLGSWSVADLVRLVDDRQWSASIRLSRHGETAKLHFRTGTLTHAAYGKHPGERALEAVLKWHHGRFELTVEPEDGPTRPTVRPPRNIHRGTRDVLIDLLMSTAEWERQLRELPRADIPHLWDAEKANSLDTSQNVAKRLRDVLDGKRTLLEAVRAAGVKTGKEMRELQKLIRGGAIQPTARDLEKPVPKPQAKLSESTMIMVKTPEPPEQVIKSDRGSYVRKGNTIRRKLALEQQEDEKQRDFEALAEEREGRRRRARRSAQLLWAAIICLAVGALVAYLLSRGSSEDVEVQVLDDPQTESISGPRLP